MLNYVAGYFISYLIFDSRSYWRDLTSAAGQIYPIGKTIPAAIPGGPHLTWEGRHPARPDVGVGADDSKRYLAQADDARPQDPHNGWFCDGRPLRRIQSSQAPHHRGHAHLGRPCRDRRTARSALLATLSIRPVSSRSNTAMPASSPRPWELRSGPGFAGGLLLGAITSAGSTLVGPSFPVGLVGTIEWIVLFSVISAAFLVNYRVRWRRRGRGEEALLADPDATSVPPESEQVLGEQPYLSTSAQVTRGG